MCDYIVTYGKLLDEFGGLKPPGLLWFELGETGSVTIAAQRVGWAEPR